jgi:hypothetical protein
MKGYPDSQQLSPDERNVKKTRLASAINFSKNVKKRGQFPNSMHFGPGQLKNLANKSGINSGRSQSKNGRNLKIHT